MPEPLPFIDLQAQRRRLGPRLDEAIARVLAHGRFIMGPEIGELEAGLGAFAGTRHVIACGNGTDALALVLMAKDVRSGDAILVPSFTFVATAEVVVWLGAVPVFCDVRPDTFNLDPLGLEAGLKAARDKGLTPRGVIAVGLFGQPAEMDRIGAFCAEHGVWLLDDAAQSFGASYNGRKVGTLAETTATSFFPAKPLGCYGDGGAVLTDDDQLAGVIRSLRIHGQGQDQYDNVRVGMNGRMDTLQAAVLLQKLEIFEDEIRTRQEVAARYAEGLGGLGESLVVPAVPEGLTSVWAQYTILLQPGVRAPLAAALEADGIPTAVYYRTALHQQGAYRHFPCQVGGLPVSEDLSARVLSLPMHPYLEAATQDRIVTAIRRHLGA